MESENYEARKLGPAFCPRTMKIGRPCVSRRPTHFRNTNVAVNLGRILEKLMTTIDSISTDAAKTVFGD